MGRFVPDTPAPVARGRFVPDQPSFLDDATGIADVARTGLVNTFPAAANTINDIGHRIVGDTTHAHDIEEMPLGPNGQRVLHNVAGALNIGGAGGPSETPQALAEREQAFGGKPPLQNPLSDNARQTLGDVATGAQHVLGESLNLVPEVGVLGKTASRSARIASEAATPIAAGDIEHALTAVGYKNLPRQGGGSAPARVGANIVGEEPLASVQTLHNQSVTDAIAKQEAGVPQEQSPELETLKQARTNGPGRVYNAAHDSLPVQLEQDPDLKAGIAQAGSTVSQLPKSPDADAVRQFMLAQPTMTRDELFQNIQEARERAAKFYASDKPDADAIGDTYQGIANAYEEFVGRKLPAGGPVNLQDWQAARKAFAKNYAVQAATRGTSVDASVLARLQNKQPELLDGGLRLIAEQANRYPLSTGFGPRTFSPGGEIGASGSLSGAIGRHITGPIIGAAAGGALGGHSLLGAAAGGAASLGAAGVNSILRRVLGGNPAAGEAAALEAMGSPRLESFFPPPGPQYERLPPGPGPILTGRQVATEAPPATRGTVVQPNPNPLTEGDLFSQLSAGPMGAPPPEGLPFTPPPESVGMGPLRSGRQASEPAPSHIIGLEGEPVETGVGPRSPVGDRFAPQEGSVRRATPIASENTGIGGAHEDYEQMLNDAFAQVKKGNFELHPTPKGDVKMTIIQDSTNSPTEGRILAFDRDGNNVGDLGYTIGEGPNGLRYNPQLHVDEAWRRQGIANAMYDLAEKNGASIPDLNQPGQLRTREGQAFREARANRPLFDELSDVPSVMHQNRVETLTGPRATQLQTSPGVPEDLFTRLANNASGESSASMEAINRSKLEHAQGQDRFLIDPDGKMWPIRGVEAADATAPKGSIIVQKGVGGTPYTILDRGGLPSSHANGLLNRALAARGTGMTLMDLMSE